MNLNLRYLQEIRDQGSPHRCIDDSNHCTLRNHPNPDHWNVLDNCPRPPSFPNFPVLEKVTKYSVNPFIPTARRRTCTLLSDHQQRIDRESSFIHIHPSY